MVFVPSQRIAALLNHMLQIDPEATAALIEARVPCNDKLADHPSIQVHQDDDGACTVGVLGILNGLCNTRSKDGVFVIAVYKDGKLNRFQEATLSDFLADDDAEPIAFPIDDPDA
jgi:hypothetical protein